MTLLEACQAKKDKTIKKTWDELNDEFGKPYKNGECLRNIFKNSEFDEKKANRVSGFEEKAKTADELIAEEKTKQRLAEETKQSKAELKTAAQVDTIKECLREACKVVEPYPICKVEILVRSGEEKTTPILLHSDVQAGTKISAEATGSGNDYNKSVLEVQMSDLLKGIVSITTKQLKSFRKIKIFMMGDMLEGHGIFPSQAYCMDMDLYEQFFVLAELESKFLQELCQLFDAVEIVTVSGNHGRIGKKGEVPDYLNWDNFWYEYMVQKLQNFPKITWKTTKSWWQIDDTDGWKTFITHGDGIRSWNGIPYYGIDRKDAKQTKLLASRQLFYNYMVLGHFHTPAELPTPTGPIFINGCLPGGSVFVQKNLTSANRPQQTLLGIHKDRGKTFSYPIYLDY